MPLLFLQQFYSVEERLCAIVEFSLPAITSVPQEVMGLLFIIPCQAQELSFVMGLSIDCAKSVMFAPGGRAFTSKDKSVWLREPHMYLIHNLPVVFICLLIARLFSTG